VSRVHGDFWLGNVLVGGEGGDVTGVIDWDRAGRHELSAHDLVHLLLVTRMYARPQRQFGEEVASFLGGAGWDADELEVLGGADLPFPATDRSGQRLLVLLAWLRRVVADLDSVDLPPSQSWIERNIEIVLSELYVERTLTSGSRLMNSNERS
jgi:Ser/Thr protein kinase RdoA (MazF antagonist)